MVDSLSGHTAAGHTLGNDGLRDGDSLSSPTLTNMLQGLKGNGILRMQDTLMAATDRNNVINNPGYVAKTSANTLTITGGYVTLEGQLYEFAGGPGGTAVVTIGTHGTGTALAASGEQSMYVVYVASQGGSGQVYADGGTPVKTSTGLYPSLPSQYLTNYDTGTTRKNQNVVVLATVRCEYNNGGGSHKVNVIEINDKRTYLRSNPIYMFPVTSGGLTNSQIDRSSTKGVQTAAELRALFAAPESGVIGANATGTSTPIDAGVLWMSTSKDGASLGFGPGDGSDRGSRTMQDELFFAAQENSGLNLVSKRLFTQGISAPSGALTNATYTITSHGDQKFILNITNGNVIKLNPEKNGSNYLFPEGHLIDIYITNTTSGSQVLFDEGGLGSTLSGSSPGGTRRQFVYDGSAWVALPYSAGGVTAWLALDDTPSSYTAGKAIKVNSAGNALEFYDAATALNGIDDTSGTSGNPKNDLITIDDNGVRINVDHDDVDFKVISDDESVILHVDGAAGGKVGIDQATPETTMQMKSVAYEYGETAIVTFSSSSATTLDLFDLLKFRSAEVTLEVANLTDKKYETCKILITTPYTSVAFTGDTNSNTTVDAISSMNDISTGMSITGGSIPGNTTITVLGGSQVTISQAATTTTTSGAVAFTAQSKPNDGDSIPYTVYSITNSDQATTNTAQLSWTASDIIVDSNKARLALKGTADSNGDKVQVKAYWRAIAI